jgi:hypothetical protein
VNDANDSVVLLTAIRDQFPNGESPKKVSELMFPVVSVAEGMGAVSNRSTHNGRLPVKDKRIGCEVLKLARHKTAPVSSDCCGRITATGKSRHSGITGASA